jgi:hypothetical protein
MGWNPLGIRLFNLPPPWNACIVNVFRLLAL